MAKRSLQSLRDEWFRFVNSSRPDHRPWAQWWKQQGVQTPVDAFAGSESIRTADERWTDTYLLTWDPQRHQVDEISQASAQLEHEGKLVMNWSVGHHGIQRGNRVFFMRHGENEPGLIGAGHVISDIREGPHWDETKPADWTAYYAQVQWEVLHPLPIIPLMELVKQTGEEKLWTETGSGLPIPPQLAAKLEKVWDEALAAEAPSFSSAAPVAEKAAVAAATSAGVTLGAEFSATVESPEASRAKFTTGSSGTNCGEANKRWPIT